jgi:hypothetical protein
MFPSTYAYYVYIKYYEPAYIFLTTVGTTFLITFSQLFDYYYIYKRYLTVNATASVHS